MGLNFDTIFKLAMSKVKIHKGRRYVFRGLITQLCGMTGMPEQKADYYPVIHPSYVSFGLVLTTIERAYWNEMIMASMYGLEMLRH